MWKTWVLGLTEQLLILWFASETCSAGLQRALSQRLPSGVLRCDWRCQKLNCSWTGSPRRDEPPEPQCGVTAGGLCRSGSSYVWPYRMASQLCLVNILDFLADCPRTVTHFSLEMWRTWVSWVWVITKRQESVPLLNPCRSVRPKGAAVLPPRFQKAQGPRKVLSTGGILFTAWIYCSSVRAGSCWFRLTASSVSIISVWRGHPVFIRVHDKALTLFEERQPMALRCVIIFLLRDDSHTLYPSASRIIPGHWEKLWLDAAEIRLVYFPLLNLFFTICIW